MPADFMPHFEPAPYRKRKPRAAAEILFLFLFHIPVAKSWIPAILTAGKA